MHLIGVRRTLAERHPWLPAAVLAKAFEQAKAVAFASRTCTGLRRRMGPTTPRKVGQALSAACAGQGVVARRAGMA